MQTLPIKYTDRIHGFQGRFVKVVTKAALKTKLGYDANIEDADRHIRCDIVRLTRRRHECSCGCRNVTAYRRRTRYVQGEPMGEMQTFYEVDVHLLKCGGCGSLPFLPHPMARITKSFARLMVLFRESISITDVGPELRPCEQRFRRGLQHEGAPADEATLRPTRLPVPEAQDHGPPLPQDQGQRLTF